MAEGSTPKEGDSSKKITELSNSIQNHFRQFRKESMASADLFQIHADQNEVDSFLDESLDQNSVNSNNNTPDNTIETMTQVTFKDSFHSIPSDEEQNLPESRSSESFLVGNEPPENEPKPQRAIKKANKKFLTKTKPTSVTDYFSPRCENRSVDKINDSRSSQENLDDAMLLSPIEGSSNDKFIFSAPQSIVSLPTILDNSNKEQDFTQEASTSVGSSINEAQSKIIIPNLVDQLTAGSSKGGNAPTMETVQDFLNSPAKSQPSKRKITDCVETQNLIDEFVNSAKNPNLSITASQVKESVRQPIDTRPNTDKKDTVNIDFDVSHYINECNKQVNITLQSRMDVRIFPPALTVWRSLRTQQGRKVTLELRIAYHQKLISTDHFPDWTVSFHPPTNLLQTERAIDEVASFRMNQSKEVMRFTIELMKEESARLTHEINVGLNSLRMHYEHENAMGYDIKEALEALNTFMRRTKETEVQDLNKKYTAIHTAPLASIYTGFPEGTILPPGAVRIYRQERVSLPPANPPQSQGFRNTGRGS